MQEILTTFVSKSYIMEDLNNRKVEDVIIQEIQKLKGLTNVDPNVEINKECKPGKIGVHSQILVEIMGRLEEILKIDIPHNCYIFRDKDGVTELSIVEAAEKLIKYSKRAKK